MTTLKLLPRWFRFLGLTLIIPMIIGVIYDPEIVFGELRIPFASEPNNAFTAEVPALLDQTATNNDPNKDFVLFSWIKNDLSNELLLTFMLLGTYFIAFARVKGEDEFSEKLRLESMTSAIVWNSILLLAMNWLFYDGIFLYVIVSQLFSFLMIFSIIFAFKIRNQRKSLAHEE